MIQLQVYWGDVHWAEYAGPQQWAIAAHPKDENELPKCLLPYLAVDADATSEHGDDTDAVLPDHLPEVNDGVWHRRLSRYVPELLVADLHLMTYVNHRLSVDKTVFYMVAQKGNATLFHCSHL